MNLVGAIRLLLANLLRVVHIALWLAIPATFWLWLLSEPPAECVPKYGWYQGNVLCVSEEGLGLIAGGLIWLGFFVVPFWVFGYWFEIIRRVLAGDDRLPPVRLRVIRDGYALFWPSLGYWLPAIAYVLCTMAAANVLPRGDPLRTFDLIMLLSAPFMLLMYWGYLVCLARYATSGERALFCRRRENMKLALMNLRATLALMFAFIFALIVATIGGAFAMASMEFLARALGGSDPMVVMAVGSFVFFFALLSWSVVCSRLVAGYARRIGIGNRLSSGAKLG